MKKIGMSVMMLLLSGLLATGCSHLAIRPSALESLRPAFERAALNLDTQYHQITECGEKMTWLPDQGLRGLYCHVKAFIPYAQVQRLSKETIFLKGPHTPARLDLASDAAFGYYNPAFVKAFRQQIVTHFLSDPQFIAKTRLHYDQYLSEMLRSYYRAYQFIDSGETWVANPLEVTYNEASPLFVNLDAVKTAYLAHLDHHTLPDDFWQEIFRSPSEESAGTDDEWYNVNTALGWWTRRCIDGTHEEFFRTLNLVLKTYDTNFLEVETGR